MGEHGEQPNNEYKLKQSHKLKHLIVFSLLLFLVVENGCAHLREESPSPASAVEYAPMKWFETPSIVSYAAGDI